MNPYYRFFQYQQSIGALLPECGERSFQVRIRRCHSEPSSLEARDRLPTMFAPSRVSAGGLIAYGTSQVEAIRRMAVYVDKVLKGGKPGELSVETVTRYELVVNLKTAREIGVTIPPEVLKRADRVIQ